MALVRKSIPSNKATARSVPLQSAVVIEVASEAASLFPTKATTTS